MKHEPIVGRRRFLKTTAQAAALVPFVSLLDRSTWAADLEPVPADNPQAKALAYFANAADAGSGEFPNWAATQFCDNCVHYTAIDDATGKCALIPNYSVAAKGWCKVWMAAP